MDPGERLLAAALLQGSLDWPRLREALAESGDAAQSPFALLRHLAAEGRLPASELALLEQRFPSSGGPADRDPMPPDAFTGMPEPARWRQYRNLRFLAEGGMGRVYRAYDSTLHRMVALKFLRRRDPEQMARFRQEAQLHARLEHPHICRVYEVVEWEGQACIAMQFIPGDTLDVAALRLSVREKLSLMADVADAVHAAHRQGLIHRDLKPANIMVERPEGLPPRAMVLDFGLARSLEEPGLTQDGAVLGTFQYMAPEQAAGGPLDRRTDVYALGATLYAVLAGRPPFGDSEGSACVAQIAHKEAVPLSRLVPDLPRDLDTVVATCLQKDPAHRYATARDLGEDLRRLLDDEPILARRPSRLHRMGRFAARHRAWMSVLTGISLVALVSAAFGIGTWLDARTQARMAQDYGQYAERLEAMGRYIALMPPHDIRAARSRLHALMSDLERQIQHDGPLAEGPGAYALGRGFLVLHQPVEARARLERALALGFRSPLVRLALGQAQAELYRLALEQARNLQDPELRRIEQRQATRRWKEPALSNLRAGGTASPDASDLAKALVAVQEERFDEGLTLARQAQQRAPWLFEAHCLEGDVLLAQAKAAPAQAMARIEAALRAFETAASIAPSDPGIPLRAMSAHKERLVLLVRRGEDPAQALAACLQAARTARRLDPTSTQGQVAEAAALHLAVRVRGLRSPAVPAPDPSALALVREALKAEPGSEEARLLHMELLLQDARARLNRFEDPRPALSQVRQEALSLVQSGRIHIQALQLSATACGMQLTYEAQRGPLPYGVFEEGLSIVRTLMNAQPSHTGGWWLAGYLWLERAEHERQLGLDPRPSCAWASRCWDTAERLDPGEVRTLRGQATTHLVAGEYLLDHGEDPEAMLAQAIASYDRILEMRPGDGGAQYERAEALLLRARYLERTGGNALAAVQAALQALPPRQAGSQAALELLHIRVHLLAHRCGLRAPERTPDVLLRRLDRCRKERAGVSALRNYQLTRAEVLALLGSARRPAGAQPAP